MLKISGRKQLFIPKHLVKMMQIFYIIAMLSVVHVDCQGGGFTPARRYRYETPTIKFPVPNLRIEAAPAHLNFQPGTVQQSEENPTFFPTSVDIPSLETPTSTATQTPTSSTDSPQDGVSISEPSNLAKFFPLLLKNKNVSNEDSIFPLGHTAVSPYYADSDGNIAPSPPNTQASDLTDDNIHLCPKNFTGCDPSYPWRSIEGTCNNLANPFFGAANQPMPRLLGAKFDIGMVRTFGEDGSLLPNPRSISTALNLPPRRRTNHNLLIMQIGQFVDHDHVLTSGVRGPNGEHRKCNSCKSWTDPACMPIPIPADDPFFPSHSKDGEPNCLPFVRSVVLEGKFNTVDPLNFNTAFLDLSTVYASDSCQNEEVRFYRHGLMRMDHVYDVPKGLPPSGFHGFEECRLNSKKCMLTGDVRGNEHLTLLMMHTIFIREHNRLAKKLYSINRHWDDERIFQEARRINIAQYQHIIYQEYLPALIGFSKAREYGLQALSHGYYMGYSETINPGIVNEFAGAAYRIGHSMVPEAFPKYNKDFQFVGELPLRETFHNPRGFGDPKEFDDCLRGLVGAQLPALDLHFEDVIKRHLFEFLDKPFSGEDLLARNIARGREFGFPGYTNYVQLCGVAGTIDTWADLYTLIDPLVVQYLQRIYKHPKDIDLFIGGMAEYQSHGALVGPTFSCIIANQFIGAKRGDRFWYENESSGLTLQQLNTIRKTSRWSRTLCKNMNEDSSVPYYSTIIPIKSSNPLVNCEQLEDLDFSAWAESTEESTTDSCTFRGITYHTGDQVQFSACSFCICTVKGEVNCVAADVNCGTLSESDKLDESCQLICDQNKSSGSLESAENADKIHLENNFI